MCDSSNTLEDLKVSQLINVRGFLKECSDLFRQNDKTPFLLEEMSLKDYLIQCSTIDSELLNELESVCGIKTLKCEGQTDKPIDMLSAIPEGLQFQTTSFQKSDLKRRQESPNYQKLFSRKLGMYGKDKDWAYELCKSHTGPDQEKIKPGSDVLLNIRVYRSYNKNSFISLSEEFEVLGRQKLTSLRDKIHCYMDEVVAGEFSDNPEIKNTLKAKDLYKSGFFFINNIFYNDMRDEKSNDYSQEIREWAHKSKDHIRFTAVKSMEENTFLDLSVQLGKPYLYLHQGDCEHIIVFSDIRLLNNEDIRIEAMYPVLLGKLKYRRVLCHVCHLHTAIWMTRNSHLAPEDPCFFCDTCLRLLHYTSDGKKIGDFKLFQYVDRSAL